jgi:hypothetical protein
MKLVRRSPEMKLIFLPLRALAKGFEKRLIQEA